MKTKFFRSFPAATGLILLSAGAGVLTAQQTPANAPKPPVHKPEQSALNRLKQDDRSKEELIEAGKKLLEATKRNEAAEKEIKRMDSKSLTDDPGKAVEAVKNTLTAEDAAALKVLQEKAKATLDDPEIKKALEEAKKKAANSVKPKTSGTPTTPPDKFGPSTFDQVPAPTVPVPGATEPKRRDPNFQVTGDAVIFPPSRDPSNPERVLPPSDPRTRTYVVTGNGQVKAPNMVLEGDRIVMVASAEGDGNEGFAGLGSKPSGGSAKKTTVDPVQPGINAEPDAKKSTPFDRVIATGRVNIVRLVSGKTQTGKGGSMIYDKKTGTMVLTDWPQAQVEGKVITGRSKEAKIILVPNGEPRVENCRVDGYEENAARPAAAAAAPAPKAVPVQ